ncbi:MAG: c-type cytochrome [Armatimonadetes bacterium]|nr:c-type cytochrome [Armatimonadota bacterium]
MPGVRLFYRYDCGKCHTVRNLPEARGTLGVPLEGVATRAAGRVGGLDARTYLRQSLVEPRAYIVEGFLEVMPSYKDQMTEAELTELVDWLMSLEKPDES